jgi:hypothetical protein
VDDEAPPSRPRAAAKKKTSTAMKTTAKRHGKSKLAWSKIAKAKQRRSKVHVTPSAPAPAQEKRRREYRISPGHLANLAALVADAVRTRPATAEPDPLEVLCLARAGLSTLPSPLHLSNAQVLCEPYMWLVLQSQARLRRADFRGPWDTPGPFLQAARQACRDRWGTETNIPVLMEQISVIQEAHPSAAGLQDLMVLLQPLLAAARAEVDRHDTNLVAAAAGPKAASAYALLRGPLSATKFPASASEALKKVGHLLGGRAETKKQTDTGKRRKRGARCRLCGEEVTGPFAAHRQKCQATT